MKLNGGVAIVTGDAIGIDRVYALSMAEGGADIVIADIDIESVKVVAGEVETLKLT